MLLLQVNHKRTTGHMRMISLPTVRCKGALNLQMLVPFSLSLEVCEGIMYIEKYSLYSFSRKVPALDRVRSYIKM